MVVGSAGQEPSYLRPLVAMHFLSQDDDFVFEFAPLVLLDVRVQVVVPPLSALLADPAFEALGNETPVLGPVEPNVSG